MKSLPSSVSDVSKGVTLNIRKYSTDHAITKHTTNINQIVNFQLLLRPTREYKPPVVIDLVIKEYYHWL